MKTILRSSSSCCVRTSTGGSSGWRWISSSSTTARRPMRRNCSRHLDAAIRTSQARRDEDGHAARRGVLAARGLAAALQPRSAANGRTRGVRRAARHFERAAGAAAGTGAGAAAAAAKQPIESRAPIRPRTRCRRSNSSTGSADLPRRHANTSTSSTRDNGRRRPGST